MLAVHQVERDPDGVQMAVRELFEESFFEEGVKSILAKLGDDEATRERILQDRPLRTLSPGYYSRAAYVLDLASSLEVGAVHSAASLLRTDVTGLQAVKRAKAEFEFDHPSCPACGKRQDNRFMNKCMKCGIKVAGRGD